MLRYHHRVRILFLDVDGVLNRTGYQPDNSEGLRSWIEPELAAQLTRVLRVTRARIVMSSDWRLGRELHELHHELAAAGVEGAFIGVTPALRGAARWREIHAWMEEHAVAEQDVAIVDDCHDMGPLAARFVRASPLCGLDAQAAEAIIALFDGRPTAPHRAD